MGDYQSLMRNDVGIVPYKTDLWFHKKTKGHTKPKEQKMEIFPAIDIKNKKVVRLLKGDYSLVTEYEQTPIEAALFFQSQGAKNLHMVDLDGAKDGTLSNFDAVKEVCENTSLYVEIGGGIRSMDRIEKYLSVGVGRVILGTAALENPDFLREAVKTYGDKIAVGVDAADSKVATRGWLNVSDTDSFEFCKKMRDEGVKSVIYTDISRDGTLSGTNMEAYRKLSLIEGLSITASGGITHIDEIKELSEIGTWGAILGKALYSGKIDLKEALSASKG